MEQGRSADELLLQHMSQIPLQGQRILVVNDQSGALSCGLKEFDVTSYTDSFLGAQSIQLASQGRSSPLHRLEDLQGMYDWVLIRLPKNLSFFEDILAHLSAHLHAGSKVVCGYMVKHQSKASFDLLNRYIGETSTSLARKKARLIFADFQRAPVASPYPLRVSLEGFENPFVNHSNLFSREKLDIGTRFLLEHIPQGDYRTILDLGCGNGVIGIAAKKLNPAARLVFSDESFMAIQSAETNYRGIFEDAAEYHWTNCCADLASGSVDLVLCNPPFHQDHAIGDAIAWQMFKDAHRALAAGGTLRVIGNTHLQYQVLLKKVFGGYEPVTRNSKFVIVDAVKPAKESHPSA